MRKLLIGLVVSFMIIAFFVPSVFAADDGAVKKNWGIGVSVYGIYPLGNDPVDLDIDNYFTPQDLIRVYFNFKNDGESIEVPYLGQLPFEGSFYDVLGPWGISTGDLVDEAVVAIGYKTFQIDGSGTISPCSLPKPLGYIIAKEDYDIAAYAVALGNKTFVTDTSSYLDPALFVAIELTTPAGDWLKPFVGFRWQGGGADADFYVNAAYIDGIAGVHPVETKEVLFGGCCWPDSDYYFGLALGLTTANRSYRMSFNTFGIPVGIKLETDLGFIKPGSFLEKTNLSIAGFWMPTFFEVHEDLSALTVKMPYHTAVLDPARSWDNDGWDLSAGGVNGTITATVFENDRNKVKLGVAGEYIYGLQVKGAGPMNKADVNPWGVGAVAAWEFDFLGRPISANQQPAPVIDPKIEPMSSIQ